MCVSRSVGWMSGSHSERADELAFQAKQELKMLLALTEPAILDGGPGPGSPYPLAVSRSEGSTISEVEVRWMRIQALQNQAQIHATLALNDTLPARSL